tara:strand:- start:1210 stop:1359 length:150 start_codon:yes stop_codon:yes gene_type:complete
LIDKKSKEQAQKFIDKAKELGCDESEGKFDEKLREIAKPRQGDDKPKSN